METENLKEEALNYNKAKPELDKLIGTWSTPIMEIKKTRAFRKITRDPAKLRAQKKLAKDETLIIIRSVDNNIRRIKPNWLAYVVSSRRIVEVMDDSSGGRSSANARRLETDFSADLRTSETIRSFSQQIDSCYSTVQGMLMWYMIHPSHSTSPLTTWRLISCSSNVIVRMCRTHALF